MNTDGWVLVNAAIADCLKGDPSYNDDFTIQLKNKYGETVTKEVLSILAFTLNIPPNWENESFDSFLRRSEKLINENYSNLNLPSVDKLINQLAYHWMFAI